MAAFVFRRLLASVLILLGASFLVYMMMAFTLDPLRDLRESRSATRDIQMADRIARLDLNSPWIVRYFDWLRGAASCVAPIGPLECDLGLNRSGQSVNSLLAGALGSTLRLVTVSTVAAWVVGITVGIVSALRQNSGFDYGVTFTAFLFFSLPSFWVAVLMKEFVALPVNAFFEDPSLPWWAYVLVFVVFGTIMQSALAGDRRRRLIVFAGAGAVATGLLALLVTTQWFLDPGFGYVGVVLMAAVIGGLTMVVLAGTKHRGAQITAGVTAVLGVVSYPLVQIPFNNAPSIGLILGLAVAAIAVGMAVGWLAGGYDRGMQMRLGAIIAFLIGAVILLDRFMQAWAPYLNYTPVQARSGPVPTVGSSTPLLDGSFWVEGLDLGVSLLLPTFALVLVSIATYSRYTRAGMIDVLGQDYIRTARAKGLPERVVVVRHAFRNSLIPLATIVATDIGALLGGAVITEKVFSIPGMGALFTDSLLRDDPNPVMAFFLVVAAFAILFNFIADMSYAVLDPRVRSH
ncbi:ABC transporter permease [Nocardioides zeae]|uniref:ABC transporter permease n=1 Tax=Nocardioides imazamoxiresistens TaxID=3231893 RepID=A0ABU3PXB4_9ACTN|nr:ABC transporter permease [Nocardioides zeae]MDT9593887.1 ABC transporter permease [Nocardioides zeae]